MTVKMSTILDCEFVSSAAVKVYRGDEIEAIHHASVAVVGPDGNLTHYLGNPQFVTMMRSCLKPFQLLPLIISGAADHFGYEPRQLAIMCGSHCGTDQHRELVLQNLSQAGNTAHDLGCGSHWPLGMVARQQYPRDGEDSDPVRHNCSGKHSGFLALAKFLGDFPTDYLSPKSATQQAVKKAVSDFCRYPIEQMPDGIDGCSAPNFPLPLPNVADAFRRLAGAQSDDSKERVALTRIRDAMWRYPEMVSGDGRFDLALSQTLPDNIICKIGAESVEGIGLVDPPIGVAVKIHDGGDRALGPVVVEVLRQLAILSEEDLNGPAKRYVRPEVRNARDIVTGHVVTCFKLRKT